MHKYLTVILLILVSLIFILIGGCEPSSDPKGLIASVNGEPIYLRTLQTLQDMQTYGLGAKQRISVPALKKEYGLTLSTLITNILVMQELKKIQLEITNDDFEKALLKISSAYPDGEFEKIFSDENIDVNIWNDLLLQQLSVEKFQNEVIHSLIVIPEEEIVTYYENNNKYFYLPERFTLTQYISTDEKLLTKVFDAINKTHNALNADVEMFTFTIRRNSIPEEWVKDIIALKVGENTPIIYRDKYFQFFTLVEITPAKNLTLLEILPIIHKKLSAEKIENNFKLWLEDTIKKSDIKISKHLLSNINDIDMNAVIK